MDDFGLLVGQFTTALPTLASGQFSELQLDEKGRLIISGRWLEDSAHVSGDAGIFALAIRNDAAGVDGVQASVVYDTVTFTAVNMGVAGNSIALVFNGTDDIDTVVNAWNLANPSNQVGFTGQLGTYVPAAGTATLLGGINDSALTSADFDYSGLAVDKYGRLKVLADLDIDFDYVYAEDSQFANGNLGAYVLAVRQDVLAADTSQTGDFASFKVNAKGELYVHDTDALGVLTTIDTVLDNSYIVLGTIDTVLDTIKTDTGNIATSVSNIDTSLNNIETDIDNLTNVEDEQHSSGDSGVMSLAVRNDLDAAFTNQNGDYSPINVDAAGRIKVISSPVGSEQFTVTDALAAAGDGLETITAAATPWVTVASLAVGVGINAFLYAYQWTCDQNAQMRIVTDDGVSIKVYKTDVNSSAMPGTCETWSEGGRIEIPGALNLEIKLQIKKRSVPGGNALGSGSMHIRTA